MFFVQDKPIQAPSDDRSNLQGSWNSPKPPSVWGAVWLLSVHWSIISGLILSSLFLGMYTADQATRPSDCINLFSSGRVFRILRIGDLSIFVLDMSLM